jgi:hypothetical protein
MTLPPVFRISQAVAGIKEESPTGEGAVGNCLITSRADD